MKDFTQKMQAKRADLFLEPNHVILAKANTTLIEMGMDNQLEAHILKRSIGNSRVLLLVDKITGIAMAEYYDEIR
jgi:hypothetical protein